MTVGEALRQQLVTSNALVALVADRIDEVGDTEQNPTHPYVTYFEIPGQHGVAHDGPSGMREARVQFDVYALTAPSRQAVADEIRFVVNGLHVGNGPEQIQAAQLLSDGPAPQPEEGGRADRKVFHHLLEVGVQKRESVQ